MPYKELSYCYVRSWNILLVVCSSAYQFLQNVCIVDTYFSAAFVRKCITLNLQVAYVCQEENQV